MRLPWGRFRQLRRRAEDLQLLVEAGRELSNTLSMDEIYTIIHRFVAHCVPCDNLIVSAYDPLTQLITCSYLHSEEGVVDVSAFPPIPLEPEGQGTQSLVIRSGQPLLLPDYEARRRSARNAYFFDEQGNILVESQVAEDESIPRSALLVPLLQDGQVVGVLQVLSNTLNAHNADHLRFLEALAFRATSALSNARLFQRLQAELEERRRAEDEILQLNANLEQRVAERTADLSRLNAELEQAVRTKNEFLATMSHELRTPLNAVLTFTESLTEGIYGPVNPRQGSALRMVMESGQRLLTLINDLLDLARIEAGRADLDQVFTDVHLACRSSLEMVRELAGRKQLSMQLDWDPQAAALRVDPRALKQMLGNLLGNAVKFTPQGGRIGLRVRGDYERGEMLFTVWDTGIGISEEQAARLFQPFVQLDNGLARAYEGAGMGLALVYRLCELHGGSVTLESAPGQGSRFTIALPWNALEQPGEAQPAAFAGRQAAPAGSPAAQPSQGVSDAQPGAPRPVKILIAEDNPANQVVYEDFLSSLGYQVFAAVNGQDALELAARLTPDLILMDIQMPVMNGLDALECLHGSPALAHIPVIALTALAMPGDRERCLNAGAREYLAKPVSLKLLAEMVHRYAR